MMPLITMNALTKAIQHKLNISEQEAKRYAGIVLDIFGYDDCIIDNILDHRDRRLFYRLQSEGLLNTLRDEVTLCDGKSWRIHYWMLQKRAILTSALIKQGRAIDMKNRGAPSYKTYTVYSSLPDKAWANRKPSSYDYPLS